MDRGMFLRKALFEDLSKTHNGQPMLVKALELYGITELPNFADSPFIMSWVDEVEYGIPGTPSSIFTHDEVAWCGLFMAVVAVRSRQPIFWGKGITSAHSPYWALHWQQFGNEVTGSPVLGDVLVFKRKIANGKFAGHVGMYVGEDSNTYFSLGGNQSNSVSIQQYSKSDIVAKRRPIYKKVETNLLTQRIVKVDSQDFFRYQN